MVEAATISNCVRSQNLRDSVKGQLSRALETAAGPHVSNIFFAYKTLQSLYTASSQSPPTCSLCSLNLQPCSAKTRIGAGKQESKSNGVQGNLYIENIRSQRAQIKLTLLLLGLMTRPSPTQTQPLQREPMILLPYP